jgi:hypothetical protein
VPTTPVLGLHLDLEPERRRCRQQPFDQEGQRRAERRRRGGQADDRGVGLGRVAVRALRVLGACPQRELDVHAAAADDSRGVLTPKDNPVGAALHPGRPHRGAAGRQEK